MTTRIEQEQSLNGPPGKMVGVYITAKLIHATMLRDIRKDWPRLYFTARWPLTANLPSEQAKPSSLWTQDNETDMIASQVVVGFSDPTEATPLSDPLWELGQAHAHRKPIYLAGPVERFGKYAFCSSVVRRFDTLPSTLNEVSRFNNYETHSDRLMNAIAEVRMLLEGKI